MKQLIIVLICIGFVYQLKAEKTEKKGFFFNRNCKPIGANKCQDASASSAMTITFMVNEIGDQTLRIRISEIDLKTNTIWKELLVGKKIFTQEEDWILPLDITHELKLPPGFKISSGEYPIQFSEGYYTIIFGR